jgi:hypothetical protein
MCPRRKRNIRYVQHPHLFAILAAFTACLKQLGCAPDLCRPGSPDAAVLVSSKRAGKKLA